MEGSNLGREFPGVLPKSMTGMIIPVQPATAAGRLRAASEAGPSHFMQITRMENLHRCWLKARQNKSKRERIRRFAQDPLRYLCAIQARLRSKGYDFGPYKYFVVREKKWRDVVDAPMKDRIVHWMLYEYLYPIWESRFIRHTYGNLLGRGTHAAVEQLAKYCRRPSSVWVLQLDLSKYFYSIPHVLLKERVSRYVGDWDIRRLLSDLVDSFYTDGRYNHLFDKDSAYRKTPEKGMPIGNLSSQLFANIFLCSFDHWVKETLRVKQYIRYVDDIVVVGESKEEMIRVRSELVERLAQDGLTVHPKKVRIAPLSEGVPYLGYVIWKTHVSAARHMRSRYHRRLRQHEQGEDRSEAIQSYKSMLKHTGASR